MKRRLPSFRDEEKVLALFDDGDAGYARWIWEMAELLPEHLDREQSPENVDLSREAFEKAMDQAEQGNPDELIRLRQARLKRSRGGRPKMTKKERLDAFPVHAAMAMVPLVGYLLARWYPDEPANEIKDRAIDVATKICNERHPSGKRLTGENVRDQLNRSENSRQRLR